ncbi:MAG: winged helix-turn-helix transcriptional regulator, partial [Erysipelotrichaceae bacterium]|nr:winged helix-turn-helix transcriptional regulator [Erysipelotrichaceae bacterium]
DKEEISQMQLRHHLHVRPGSMSEIISKMEEKGLLIRERNDEDKRHCILRITDAGRNAAAELKKPESFFKALSKEEQDTLAALLRKVVQAEHVD